MNIIRYKKHSKKQIIVIHFHTVQLRFSFGTMFL